MTALSTIAGMVPVVVGLGAGSESRAPMGACVVGGMLTSTMLTLVVIPVVYSLIDDTRGWIPAIARWFSSLFRRSGEADSAVVPATSSVVLATDASVVESSATDQVPVGASAEIDVAVNHQKG